jgi:hypothetical protein
MFGADNSFEGQCSRREEVSLRAETAGGSASSISSAAKVA